MLAMKAVRQRNNAPGELLNLFDEFRRTINTCIAIGLEEKVSSLKALSSRAYPHLNKNFLGYYRVCAISTAAGILKNQGLTYSVKTEDLTEPTLNRIVTRWK